MRIIVHHFERGNSWELRSGTIHFKSSKTIALYTGRYLNIRSGQKETKKQLIDDFGIRKTIRTLFDIH